jgi:hypothetical protein
MRAPPRVKSADAQKKSDTADFSDYCSEKFTIEGSAFLGFNPC